MFQNLLKVLNRLVHPFILCLCQQTELTPPPHPLVCHLVEAVVSRTEVKTKRRDTKSAKSGRGRGAFALYTWKAKWSPNPDGGVSVPNPSRETWGHRLFGIRTPNSLGTAKVVTAVLQVSHPQELCWIGCLLLHNKPPWNSGSERLTSQCFFGLARHFCWSCLGSVWGCGYLLGQPVSGLRWDGWDSLSMWSSRLGFLQHSGLRVSRKQAPVPKHVSGPLPASCLLMSHWPK